MSLPILFTVFLQVALAESVKEATGYFGFSVTLPSGGNSSWRLSKIEWSIFSNNTWIATYRNGKENTERITPYAGRLSLNVISGDLTIHNLTSHDAMEYTVVLINTDKMSIIKKIRLIVKQRLQKPTTRVLFSTSTEDGCWMGLDCMSEDPSDHLSWLKPPSVTVFSMSNPDDSTGNCVVYLNSKLDPVEITCVSSNNMENVSIVVTQKCDDKKPQPCAVSSCRDRYGVCIVIGVVIVFLIIIVNHCRGKLCLSKNPSNPKD